MIAIFLGRVELEVKGTLGTLRCAGVTILSRKVCAGENILGRLEHGNRVA